MNVVKKINGKKINGKKINISEALQKAVAFYQSGLFAQAIKYCEMINKYKINPHSLNLLALISSDNNDYNQAISYYNQALTIDPTFSPALYNLAKLMEKQNFIKEAEKLYEATLIHKSDHLDALSNLGSIQVNKGEYVKAYLNFKKAILLQPKDNKNWAKLSQIFNKINIHKIDEEFTNLIVSSYEGNFINHQYLLPISVPIIFNESNIKQLLAMDITQLENSFLNGNIWKLLDNKILNSMLENINIPIPQLEKLFTNLRNIFLNNYETINEENLPYIIRLATQCAMNEYVYYTSDLEQKKITKLRNLVFRNDEIIPLIILAMYEEISSIFKDKNIDNLLNNKDFSNFVKEYVVNPIKELEILQKIETIGEIKDKVSGKVRSQYEENPYPRWKKLQKIPSHQANILMKIILPSLDNENFSIRKNPKILIAGTGTGKHALITASRFEGANIIAIDLSYASLAYAIRKTEELGFKNITFKQADILNLNKYFINNKFDMIESVGVLHHMEKPEVGLGILTNILKKNGVMKLGFYSSIARKDIAKIRNQITDKPQNINDIRAFRKNLMERDNPPKFITHNGDFYSTSSCRDLLFHAQEKCYNLLEIKEMLAKEGLEFLGFEQANPFLSIKYAAIYPKDKKQQNLENWYDFEEKNPNIFGNMYQFWVKKIK